jgi:hypothetical protein
VSAVICAYHLEEARTSIAVAMDHLHKAEAADVDPDVAAPVYGDARTRLHYVDLLCIARNVAHGPDLDRERAEIDATREGL